MAEANTQLSEMALRAQMESAYAAERQKVVEQEREVLNFENQQLQQQVFHDPLTKLYNRQFLKEALGREILRCQRVGPPSRCCSSTSITSKPSTILMGTYLAIMFSSKPRRFSNEQSEIVTPPPVSAARNSSS